MPGVGSAFSSPWPSSVACGKRLSLSARSCLLNLASCSVWSLQPFSTLPLPPDLLLAYRSNLPALPEVLGGHRGQILSKNWSIYVISLFHLYLDVCMHVHVACVLGGGCPHTHDTKDDLGCHLQESHLPPLSVFFVWSSPIRPDWNLPVSRSAA